MKENSKIFRHFEIRSFFWIQKVFANIQFHLEYLKKLPISKRITGEWTRDTAGGCANYRETTNKNPIHLIQIDRPTEFIVELRAPKEYSGNFRNFAKVALTHLRVVQIQAIFIFEIYVGKSRIRHRTNLNLNDNGFSVDLDIHHSISESLYVGSASFPHWFQK